MRAEPAMFSGPPAPYGFPILVTGHTLKACGRPPFAATQPSGSPLLRRVDFGIRNLASRNGLPKYLLSEMISFSMSSHYQCNHRQANRGSAR